MPSRNETKDKLMKIINYWQWQSQNEIIQITIGWLYLSYTKIKQWNSKVTNLKSKSRFWYEPYSILRNKIIKYKLLKGKHVNMELFSVLTWDHILLGGSSGLGTYTIIVISHFKVGQNVHSLRHILYMIRIEYNIANKT